MFSKIPLYTFSSTHFFRWFWRKPELHYYRVTSVYFDGAEQSSKVVFAGVNDAMSGIIAIALIPYPKRLEYTDHQSFIQKSGVTIHDGLGRQLSLKPLSSSIAACEVLLDLTAQPKDTYWVVLELDGE